MRFKKVMWLFVCVGELLSNVAQATNIGSDSNLGYKPVAGAMGDAAYTAPQEASAAIFGNPATLTQFEGAEARELGTPTKLARGMNTNMGHAACRARRATWTCLMAAGRHRQVGRNAVIATHSSFN